MPAGQQIFYAILVAIGVFVGAMLIRDRWSRKRAIDLLEGRPGHDDRAFIRIFYNDNRERGEIAVRVRRLLVANLEMPLDGLKPADRLDDDLDAQLAANPTLFNELKEEFEIDTGVESLETFEQAISTLTTFSDLVAFVESRLKDPAPAAPEAEDPSTDWADLIIRQVPRLMVPGLVIVPIAMLLDSDLMVRVGTFIFLSGVFCLVLGMCSDVLILFFGRIRDDGLAGLFGHPVRNAIALAALFGLCWGAYVLIRLLLGLE